MTSTLPPELASWLISVPLSLPSKQSSVLAALDEHDWVLIHRNRCGRLQYQHFGFDDSDLPTPEERVVSALSVAMPESPEPDYHSTFRWWWHPEHRGEWESQLTPELKTRMKNLGLLKREVDLPLEGWWEDFIHGIYDSDLVEAIEVCESVQKPNGNWDRPAMYVRKQALAWRRKHGLPEEED